MWYYNLAPTLLNLHKLFFYLLISQIQIRNKKIFKEYKFINKQSKTLINKFFLENIQVCEKKSNKCDCLLLLDRFDFKNIIKNIRHIKRIRIYDIDYFGHFGLTMILKIHYFDFTEFSLRSNYKKDSFKNLEKLKNNNLIESINLLGNNSAFSVKKKKIVGNFIIICNDAINDEELIINNKVILAVADPLFFFSETNYSINFLHNLKRLESKIEYLVIPTIAIPIIKKLEISTPIIGINSSRFQNKIYKLKNGHIISKKTHNIFTQYMLPIAIYLNVDTYIGGFTLQDNSKNKKLWSYDKNIINNKSKNFAFKYSFFKHRNFKKYYKFHYNYIQKYLNNLENVYEL